MKKIIVTLVTCFVLSTNTFADAPSQWAADQVSSAHELGLVPERLMEDFEEDISRRDFCALCANTLRACGITGEDESVVSFSDTDDSDVLFCASLGVVSGTGNGRFEPDRAVTRQEAARLLTGTLKEINDNVGSELYLPHIFADGREIAYWARNEVYAMYHTGIMEGVSENAFDPQGSYTREQAIATFYRLYNLRDTSDLAVNKEYYPYGVYAAATKQNRDIGGNSYYIDRAYSWNVADFKPEYIDYSGNTYTADELGCTYPIGSEYMPVLTSAGTGSTRYTIVNNSGEDIASGNDISMVYNIEGDLAEIMEYGPRLYDLSTGQTVSLTGDEGEMVTSVGCGMYMVFTQEGSFFVNSSLQPVTEPVYQYGSVRFVNDLAAVQRLDGSFDVINTSGQVLKHLTLDMSKYSAVNEIFGTNVILVYTKGDGYDILRSVSGKYIQGYRWAGFLEDGCIIGEKEGIYYLLDPSGNVKFCISDKGYSELVMAEGFYMCGNSQGWDLLDTNGELLLSGFMEGYLISDGGGIYCGKAADGSLMCFDASGRLLGTIPCDINSTWDDCCFINGLIRIAQGESLVYYTPQGNRVDL